MGKFREKLQRFMIGRYGMDQLNQFLLYAVLAVILINLFVRVWPLEVLELAGIVFLYFRMFSRNMSKRSAENQWYLKKEMKVRSWWQRRKKLFAGHRDYKIFQCPKCGQKLRVPRHKGKIAIHCRKCGEEFIRKT